MAVSLVTDAANRSAVCAAGSSSTEPCPAHPARARRAPTAGHAAYRLVVVRVTALTIAPGVTGGAQGPAQSRGSRARPSWRAILRSVTTMMESKTLPSSLSRPMSWCASQAMEFDLPLPAECWIR